MNNLIKQIVESKFNFNIDIEDNNVSLSKSKYNSKSLKELIELYNDVVDLGLPSRTLWCKYNLDVNPTLLSNAKDWRGKYYSWGELEGNKTYNDRDLFIYGDIFFSWRDYKYGKLKNKLTKYCNDPELGLNGFTDNLSLLLPEDDIAYLTKKLYNYKFHIPTKELCEELINYTINYWVRNYDPKQTIHNPEDDGGIQGLNGRVFEGNGNTMFIPAAGFYNYFDIYDAGGVGVLMSSSLNLDRLGYGPSYAYSLRFNANDINIDSEERCGGYTIRPVINL